MGRSENILGKLTRNTSCDDLILSIKFTPRSKTGPQAMEHIIDIYWIYNPIDVERYTPMFILLAKNWKISASECSTTTWQKL